MLGWIKCLLLWNALLHNYCPFRKSSIIPRDCACWLLSIIWISCCCCICNYCWSRSWVSSACWVAMVPSSCFFFISSSSCLILHSLTAAARESSSVHCFCAAFFAAHPSHFSSSFGLASPLLSPSSPSLIPYLDPPCFDFQLIPYTA